MQDTDLTKKINVSGDIVSGIPVVTLVGSRKLYVENFKAIVKFQDDCIKLLIKNGCLTINGCGLSILYYDNEIIAVSGHIKSVEI